LLTKSQFHANFIIFVFSFFTWIITTMKQKLVNAIRIGLKNVKHELALKVFAMEEKYRLVYGYFIFSNKLNVSKKCSSR